jgi:transcription elongation GreA/GreB family factor
MTYDKRRLRDELVVAIRAELDAVMRAHKATAAAATHEEAKPENDKDTRALEQSYLARGEALRLEEQRAALADVQAMALQALGESGPVCLGALVATAQEGQEDGQEALFWIVQHGGGARLQGGAVLVVTPKSPLGRALLGSRAGDECEVLLAGKARIVRILSVS